MGTFFANSISPIVLNGLVGWYKMDEGSGTTANDSSVYNKPGILTNNPIWTPGLVRGTCLKFDGSTNYVNLPNGMSPIFSKGRFTLSAWVYVNNASTANTIIKNWGETGGTYHWDLSNLKSSIEIVQSTGTALTMIQGTTVLSLNTWYHVVATADGTNYYSYVNGVQDGAKGNYDGTLRTTFIYTKIAVKSSDTGGISATTPNYFNGLIDNLRIYNRALTQQEITLLYQSKS